MDNDSKFFLVFSLSIFMIFSFTISNHLINRSILDNMQSMAEIQLPLEFAVAKIKSFDYALTAEVYASVLSVEREDTANFYAHKKIYDDLGAEYDTILNYDAQMLIDNSQRSEYLMKETNDNLNELMKANEVLYVLEIKAFDLLELGDSKGAYDIITSQEYTLQKEQLSIHLERWSKLEKESSVYIREKMERENKMLSIIGLLISILLVLLLIIALFFIKSFFKEHLLKNKRNN